MFTKTTVGEWAVIGLSFVFGLVWASHFLLVFIGSLILLYILFRIVKNVHPRSEFWGAVPWIVTLAGIPILIIGIIIGLGAVVGFMTGIDSPSGTSGSLQTYSNYGMSFDYPSTIPLNTSAKGYSNTTYYEGTLQFDNPDHQGIVVAWFPKGTDLSQDSIQKVFTSLKTASQKDVPDLQMSTIQEMTHTGNTLYYVTTEGHDTTVDGKMVYAVMAIWEDPPSQRYFILIAGSYKSQDDAQSIFDTVLNSMICH